MARPRKPDDEKKVRVSFYLSPGAARTLSAKAVEAHGSEPGTPTLASFCSLLLEKVAAREEARGRETAAKNFVSRTLSEDP